MAQDSVITESFSSKPREVKIDELDDAAVVQLSQGGNLYAIGVLIERAIRI